MMPAVRRIRARIGPRQAERAVVARVLGVTILVGLHLRDGPARTLVPGRQLVQVRIEVFDHLFLGFFDETQAGSIARQPG